MKKKHFYTAVILLLLLTIGIQPTRAVINIPGDTSYYTLNGTHTYILNQDVSDTIILSNPNVDLPDIGSELDRITFDGGGHTISAPINPPPNYYGISFNQVDTSKNGYITIQNLNVTGCDVGINIQTATRINVTDTDISSCQYGISIGISGTCIIKDNTISDCTEYGIWLSGAVNNTIYNNNFLNKPNFQAYVTGGSGNVFYLELDEIGNYWSDYTGLDLEEPWGIGDSPYYFDGGQDNYPLMPTPQTKIVELIDTVEVMNLQQGIDNSLDAKLDAAFNALDDVNQNNNVAAINSLNAFINAVEAQRDNKITDAQANTLIDDANYIITLLGG